jgi:hypothetical protein
MRMTPGLRQNSAQHHVFDPLLIVGTEIKKRIEVSRIRGIRILSGRCETRTVKLDRMFHVIYIVRLHFFSKDEPVRAPHRVPSAFQGVRKAQ